MMKTILCERHDADWSRAGPPKSEPSAQATVRFPVRARAPQALPAFVAHGNGLMPHGRTLDGQRWCLRCERHARKGEGFRVVMAIGGGSQANYRHSAFAVRFLPGSNPLYLKMLRPTAIPGCILNTENRSHRGARSHGSRSSEAARISCRVAREQLILAFS